MPTLYQRLGLDHHQRDHHIFSLRRRHSHHLRKIIQVSMWLQKVWSFELIGIANESQEGGKTPHSHFLSLSLSLPRTVSHLRTHTLSLTHILLPVSGNGSTFWDKKFMDNLEKCEYLFLSSETQQIRSQSHSKFFPSSSSSRMEKKKRWENVHGTSQI